MEEVVTDAFNGPDHGAGVEFQGGPVASIRPMDLLGHVIMGPTELSGCS